MRYRIALAVFIFFCHVAVAQDYDRHALSSVGVVCVTWPRGDSAEASQSRAAVSRRLEALGHKTVDCWNNEKVDYDAQLWFWPYGGATESNTTTFFVQYAQTGNFATGQVSTSQVQGHFSGWMITLWPKGQYWAVYRDPYAQSLEDGLKRLSRTLRKAQKQKRK